jgi:acetoin utilization deacetylase AcuC-like enzyme
VHRIGFPLSEQLVQRELVITQGTIDCCHAAMKNGVGLNVAGGTHHAFADRGEGFCLLNDMAVAANYLLHKKMVRQILIVDLDVHQGNGTASLFKDKRRSSRSACTAGTTILSLKNRVIWMCHCPMA